MTFTKLVTVYSAAGVIALVAWVLNVAQLYWMAGALFLLPQVSRLLGWLELRGLLLERELPRTAHQGETVEVRLSARNQQLLPKLHLSLTDRLPAGLVAEDPEPLPVHLRPGGSDTAAYRLRLARRGLHTLAGVRVESTDLMGLCTRTALVPVESRILVYPRVVSLPEWALPTELGGGQAPLQTVGRQGHSSSFYGVRDYRPGDPLRHVHWRTAARWGQLAVVEWEAEETLDAVIAVENRRGSALDLGEGTSLDLAAGLAASLGAAFMEAGHSVHYWQPGAGGAAETTPVTRPLLLERLARLEANSDLSLAETLRNAGRRLSPGTLVCWFTPRADAATLETARLLRAAGLSPVLYVLEATGGSAAGAASRAEQPDPGGVPVLFVHRDPDLVRRLMS